MADYTFDNGLYVDGTYYNVPLTKVQRKVNKIWKYADRTEEGVHTGEILGVYFNFTLTVGDIHDREEYDKLFDDLTSTKAYRTIKMPSADGKSDFTFTAYFDSIQDEICKSYKGRNIKKGLQFQMIAQYPAKRPN